MKKNRKIYIEKRILCSFFSFIRYFYLSFDIIITWFTTLPAKPLSWQFSSTLQPFNSTTQIFYNNNMLRKVQNANLFLKTIAQLYKIPQSIFFDQINRISSDERKCYFQHRLTIFKKEKFIQYIFNLDLQGFLPQIECMQNIANLLYTMHYADSVSKN